MDGRYAQFEIPAFEYLPGLSLNKIQYDMASFMDMSISSNLSEMSQPILGEEEIA